MPKKDRLTTAEAAKLAGVQPVTWRGYVHRQHAPPPDGHLDARTPYWYRGTVETWITHRPGRGARTDLREKQPPTTRKKRTDSPS
ncbi:MAG TPA: hypothetical protein VK453_25855 [Micromonosporaceae bacterium]|nr:hypothetical protein [Micromonosporaceae bacterium]